MKIPLSFIDTFGLVPVPQYDALVRVADNFIPGEFYTMRDIVEILTEKYRKKTDKEWLVRMNKVIDAMLLYDLIKYDLEEFKYFRTNIN